MIDRLHQVEPHHAFFLLKNTLWLPKLLYIRRTTCHRTSCPYLNQMDEFLRLAVSSLTNVTFNDDSWAQAVLPVGSGGLGIRMLSDIALPAYISSLHSSSLLIKRILPTNLHLDVDIAAARRAESGPPYTPIWTQRLPHEVLTESLGHVSHFTAI